MISNENDGAGELASTNRPLDGDADRRKVFFGKRAGTGKCAKTVLGDSER